MRENIAETIRKKKKAKIGEKKFVTIIFARVSVPRFYPLGQRVGNSATDFLFGEKKY